MNVKDIVAQNEKETRAGFGDGIHELAKENSNSFNVYAVDIDKEVGEIWIQQGKVKAGTEMVRRAESVKKSLERKHPLSRKEVA